MVNLLSFVQTDGERRVFWAIQKYRRISRTEIAELTGLTSAAVTQIVKRLIEADLVAEAETLPTKGLGRGRVNITLTGQRYCALGIVVRRCDLQWALCSLDGVPLHVSETVFTGEPVVHFREVLREVKDEVVRLNRTLVSVGLGLPTFPGSLVSKAEFLVEVEKYFSDVPIYSSTNAVYAALKEEMQLLNSAPPAFLFVFIGNGIGGAVVRERPLGQLPDVRLVEAGHVGIDPEGDLCICGNRGCVELTASPLALVRTLGSSSLSPLNHELLSLPDEAVEVAAHHLAYALVSIANILDVSHVVLGGNEESVLKHLYGSLPRLLRGHTTTSGEPIVVDYSKSGEQNAYIGAAIGAVHRLGEEVSKIVLTP